MVEFDPRSKSRETVGRNERLQLQRVARKLLPRAARCKRDAAVLRFAAALRRDQQYILSIAQRKYAQVMGGTGTGGVSLCSQGASENHSRQTAQGRRGGSRVSISRRDGVGFACGRYPLPTSALSAKKFADTAKFLVHLAPGPSGSL